MGYERKEDYESLWSHHLRRAQGTTEAPTDATDRLRRRQRLGPSVPFHVGEKGVYFSSTRSPLRDPDLPLRNPALLFAPGSGIDLTTAFTGILAPPSVECVVPSASVEPILSPTADQRIPSATSTNQIVTT